MIRRSAEELVRNELRVHQIWKVFASGFLPGNSSSSCGDGGHRQRIIISSFGHHFGSENSVQGFGFVKSAVPAAPFISLGLEDLIQHPLRKEQITEKFGLTGTRDDNKWWSGSTITPPVFTNHGPERSSFQWFSSKPRRSPDQGSALLEYWKRCGTVRMLSTKTRDSDEDSHRSLDQGQIQTKEEAPVRPKSIEDFQHEEIVGPTVERDESDTANQLRESLGQLTAFMTSLRNGFLLLGGVQLLALLWSSVFHGVGFFVGLSQDFSLVMSFVFAYLLRVFGPRIEFFSKIEGRSRMRTLTLSLQAIRMLNLYFFRSSFVVKAVALCSFLALLVDILHSQLSAV
ncbi:unnamed protein product [Calypogeia fissa]